MTILIAEDDPLTRRGLVEVFTQEGWQVVAASDGEEALNIFHQKKPDAICLDIMMPKRNGYDVCREIRKVDATVPLLFLSAKSEEIDTVLGLELGADDFIVKPFGVQALLARVRAVTRRCYQRQDADQRPVEFSMNDLKIIPVELRAYRGVEAIDLSLRDIKILTLLHREKGKAVTRDQLFDECWGLDYYPSSRSLDQHISQLRKRVETDAANPKIIRTVHGVGYRFE
jgi:two-component system, OmpR family, alkaline phosphatase synthesis response regulator PhoP